MIDSLADINMIYNLEDSSEADLIITSRLREGDVILFKDGPHDIGFFKDGTLSLVERVDEFHYVRGHCDYVNYEEYFQFQAELEEDQVIESSSVIITTKDGHAIDYDFDWISGWFEIRSTEPKIWIQYDICTKFSWYKLLDRQFVGRTYERSKSTLTKKKFFKVRKLVI